MITQSPLLESDAATPTGRVSPKPRTSNPPEADDTIYLMGRPTLKRFLRFVKHNSVQPEDTGTLTDEWQTANNYIRVLEKDEAGYADHPSISKISVDDYEPLLVEFLKDPLVRYGFNTVPTEVAIVELDRMVVYQKHIDLTHVRHLKEKIGPSLSPDELFKICLPFDHPHPPVKWTRTHGDTYVFVSPSNDLRFLGPMPLQQAQITGYPPPGSLVGVVGIAVGFGSNFLNAIYAENRLILNNGSHRAFTLREMGFTHVPCIVQHVASREELEIVAPSNVLRDPDYYLKHPRPSMLKDYFNPKLRKIVPCHRRVHQVTVKFEVEESHFPAV